MSKSTKPQTEEQYYPLVKEIAEHLEMGCMVFVNPENLEIETFHPEFDLEHNEGDGEKTAGWIRIDPLDSSENYEIMRSFVEVLPESLSKYRLTDAIDGYKPFANFKRLIHDFEEREQWFEHRRSALEEYVKEYYLPEIISQTKNN